MKVNDGTGLGTMPSEEQALTSNQSKKPETVSAPYGAGENGVGPEMAKPGNRTSDVRGK
jgi:hypothetical protein